MKKCVLLILAIGTFLFLSAQYPDLPGPGGNYNLQTLPTGSYVIAMDNQNQGSGTGTFTAVINNRAFNYTAGNPVINAVSTTFGISVGMIVTGQATIPAGAMVTAVTISTVTLSLAPTASATNKDLDFGNTSYGAEHFNLKAYGLLVHLLNNNVKLKWVIKPGKVKDAVDFTVNASMIKPFAGAASARSFAAGPFVIFQQDTTGVAALIQSFNGAASADDVKVYKTNAEVNVDVRYDYATGGGVWKPRAAILDDGGNAQIHESYMINAGVPASNFQITNTPNLINDCYTFATEPHNSSAPNSIIQIISDFVRFGGNFLAECAAVRTYELSTLARFQSTNGFDNANENGDPASVNYTNTDLSYFQINGYFGMADEGGSLKTWVIPQAPGNNPRNNFHYYSHGTDNGKEYTNASVSKLVPPNQMGGLVFYLGSHSYDGTADYDINGQRLYLNAFLTPTNPQGALHTAAVINCPPADVINIVVQVGSERGPAAAYPLTYTLYQDYAPIGTFGPEDIQRGNMVTMNGPNSYVSDRYISTNYIGRDTIHLLVAARSALNCIPTRIIRGSCTRPLAASNLTLTAKRNNSLVDVRWTTEGELNNKGYYVERKVGGGNWEDIGFAPSKATGANNTETLSYSYTDLNPSKITSQYRLREVDINNKIKYSDIKTVSGQDQKAMVSVYPNPSNGNINIVFSETSQNREISVLDMSGRMIRQIKSVSNNSVRIENLQPGMYTVRVMDPASGEQSVQKIIVNK